MKLYDDILVCWLQTTASVNNFWYVSFRVKLRLLMHFHFTTAIITSPPKSAYVTCVIKPHDQEHNFHYSMVKLKWIPYAVNSYSAVETCLAIDGIQKTVLIIRTAYFNLTWIRSICLICSQPISGMSILIFWSWSPQWPHSSRLFNNCVHTWRKGNNF